MLEPIRWFYNGQEGVEKLQLCFIFIARLGTGKVLLKQQMMSDHYFKTCNWQNGFLSQKVQHNRVN